MDPADDREDVLFSEALERAKGPEREAYLDQACAGNEALRRRLAALLQADESPDPFLEPPVGDMLGQMTTQPAPDFTVEETGAQIGRYKLLEKIGEGGCGVVYLAEQEEPIRRRVAFKVIKLGMDTKQVIARFESERQALALMDHPNIAKVLDAGATDTGRPYFVMELVCGVKITDYCDQKNLSTEERLKLFVQICHALQHAHQKGIIHRDIKPSNILVTLQDPGSSGVPKVIDFGIAKAISGQRLTDKTLVTAFEQFVGTPAYMSPEQAEMSGLDIDTRSDIYALGVLLYELLTGQTPFEQKALVAAGLDEMRRIIREQEPVRPSTRLSTLADSDRTTVAKRHSVDPPQLIHLLRGDLDWIVMKALEKDRALRYDTANGLAMDVERFQSHEPVVARPHSTVYQVRKFVRRNRVMVGAAAMVGVVLVLGIFGSTWQAIRAMKAEREQSRLRQHAEDQAYVGNMRVMQEAAEADDVGNFRELLQETASYPTRGFEWYYWQRQLHLDTRTLRGHNGGVRSVGFSPDGHRIVTGSLDGTAKLWETVSGKELVTFKGHRAGINSVAFSPDGHRIVTGSLDGTAKVWEAVSGKVLLTFKEHRGVVFSVAFAPDGQRIVSGGGDRTAKVWDAASGKELLALTGHSNAVLSVAFSPDGRRIATGGEREITRVWDATNGNPLLVLKGHSNPVFSAAFSPDGQRIVTSGGDLWAKVYEAASGKELCTLPGNNALWSAAFSPDGRRIATSSRDSMVQVWDADSGKELFAFMGHHDEAWSVAFSPDGRWLVSGSLDGTAKLWDLDNREKLLPPSGKGVISAAFSCDGQRLATGCDDGMVKVWGTASGKELLSFKAHSLEAFCVVFSPDGQRLITGGLKDPTPRVWEAASGKELFTLNGHSAGIMSVVFSPDGRQIVTGSVDGTAKVWDADTGKERFTFRKHTTMVDSVAFSPDGQRIVSGGDDVTRVWEAASGKELLSLPAASQVVAFSPDGRRIVTCDTYGMAKVWDATNGKELLTFSGHSGMILTISYSPDGQRILTGGSSIARLWDAASGKELLTFKRQDIDGPFAIFSPDGQQIVTGGPGGTAKVWEAATAQEVAAWQAEEQADLERSALQAAAESALRLKDPGAIKRWLVLVPIPFQNQTGEGALKALDQEQVTPEPGLRPRANERVKVGAGALVWNALRQEDYLLDFNRLLGKETQWSVAYAVCYIQSAAAQAGLMMKVGSDDEAKIYLNGREIYRNETARACVPDQDEVTGIDLKAGLNVLLFKVVNEALGWQGSVRFTDAAGQPLKGVRVTLDPEAKD
jgi:WD40 repeat protein/tRNA A-37 threonylcarbamoyl transferase component Bud32